MNLTPKRTRQDVVVSRSISDRWTYLVQPKEGAISHFPWAKFEVSLDWVDRVMANPTGPCFYDITGVKGRIDKVHRMSSFSLGLTHRLNEDHPRNRPPILLGPYGPVVMLAPSPDGRLSFQVNNLEDAKKPLVVGKAHVSVFSDLLWFLAGL